MLLRELLEELVLAEELGSQTYEKIAEVNEGDIAKTTLIFAKEEKKHTKVIQYLSEVIEGLENPVPEEVVLLLKKNSGKGEDPTFELEGASRKQLFQYALQIEKNSIELYEEIARHYEPDTVEMKEFIKLAKGERAHMYYILKILHDLK
ncbi:hypothetical protein [Serpentinicella alkaliphila]|uniref:Rubrerythrin n=1 Tax=Serpentinicella alkaliphila TaxID=1734049 RepID=A0A4R2TPN8_9FIRM|nr:hypothetical protein [Serpentinicella alkaliphila]QUH24516.1 hypothetical protein HZR23_01015 [Serpentinicella alkaliphila]TCQ04602.1 rubrerythrin [Serpentinicella alkaliphila]